MGLLILFIIAGLLLLICSVLAIVHAAISPARDGMGRALAHDLPTSPGDLGCTFEDGRASSAPKLRQEGGGHKLFTVESGPGGPHSSTEERGRRSGKPHNLRKQQKMPVRPPRGRSNGEVQEEPPVSAYRSGAGVRAGTLGTPSDRFPKDRGQAVQKSGLNRRATRGYYRFIKA